MQCSECKAPRDEISLSIFKVNTVIYWELFWGFLQVGCFSFGGAYCAIPLIRDIVIEYGWINDETLSYMIAVSESTPGPIMVNLATYVGNSQGGLLGAIIATLAVILPAFVLILLIMVLLKTCLQNKYVQSVIIGLKPCVIGIILATGFYMIINTIFSKHAQNAIDIKATVITITLVALILGCKYFLKKKITPIMLIIIAAFLGIIINSF